VGTLTDDGIAKIFNGTTTAEEVSRITQTEGVMEE
jgi:type II secretory ATPase GspE/PulE/Tfp pilus assembly ATPase PilB-like protein